MFRFDTGKDGYLDLGELKRMMEKLGVPQTHLALKAMIKEVDEDCDDKISFREVGIHILYIIYIYTYRLQFIELYLSSQKKNHRRVSLTYNIIFRVKVSLGGVSHYRRGQWDFFWVGTYYLPSTLTFEVFKKYI